MATRAIRMVDEYPSADNKRRVDIILSNFQNFPEIMNGYEESLKFLIINPELFMTVLIPVLPSAVLILNDQ